MRAFPVALSLIFDLSQLHYSARASNGEALPWTPLSPTFGLLVSPRLS